LSYFIHLKINITIVLNNKKIILTKEYVKL